MDTAVSVKNIIKKFGEVTALDDISFNIKKNKIFGLVGPDGAGKTTLIRIMCGLLKADSGEVDFSGIESAKGIKIKNELLRKNF